MTTATWSNTGYHNTDADFRTWGSALSAQLQAMTGLAMTADTGQINWATTTRTAATDSGYEIYYLNDSIHATAPLYFKLYYGSGRVIGAPRLRIEFGTGSDGSGNLTGTHSGTIYYCNYAYDASTNTPTYTNYLCVTEGFLMLNLWKSAAFQGFVSICRTCDTSGAADSYGYAFKSYGQSTSNSGTARYNGGAVRFSGTAALVNNVANAAGYHNILKPYNMTADESILTTGNYQAWMAWDGFPDMRPMFGWCGVFESQIPDASTFSTTLVGSTARTYFVNNLGQLGNTATDLLPAYLWE